MAFKSCNSTLTSGTHWASILHKGSPNSCTLDLEYLDNLQPKLVALCRQVYQSHWIHDL